MKEICIGKTKYNISCHASCYREYADYFDRNIMADLQNVNRFATHQIELALKYSQEQPNLDTNEMQQLIFQETLSELDNYIECITKLCWICIYDNNPNITNYEDWYKSLERLSLSDDWMMEVMAICADCFR